MSNKKGAGLLQKITVQIILVGLIFAIFITAISGRISGRDVKQQILEKQLALLIDASGPGFSFEMMQKNVHGIIDDVRIEEGRIYVDVDGFRSSGGYPYFSKYHVNAKRSDDGFIVSVTK